MKMFKTDEEAVSPVIGVILMVAIVVILAAVIAAFVFGMAGSTGTTKNVGMTVTLNGTNAVDILWQGGSDINTLREIGATANGVPPDGTPPYYNADQEDFGVGNITTINWSSSLSTQRVIITGTFTDGATQVLFDRRY